MQPRMFVSALIALIFLGGLAVRLKGINDYPDDFHADRQYSAALAARAYFTLGNAGTPLWMRQVADANLRQMVHQPEPPIMAKLAGRVYRWLGGEQLWVPRSISIFSWLFGGVFLLLIAKDLLGWDAALVAVSYYLFLPFSVEASRSLQPDPMMIMGLNLSLWSMLWYFRSPSTNRLLVSGVLAGLSILVKPGACALTIVAVFVAMLVSVKGVRRSILSGEAYGFVVLAMLPSLAYLALRTESGFSYPGLARSFLAVRLLFTVYFWKGWAVILIQVLGLSALVLGLIGLLAVPRGRARTFCIAYGGAYVAQSTLLTSYTTPSHDYWHLQAIPLIAIGLGSIAVPVFSYVREHCLVKPAAILAVPVGLFWVIAANMPMLLQPSPSGQDAYVQLAREIGDAVNHSTKTVVLDHNYGRPLCYFGMFSGIWWPEYDDMFAERVRGEKPLAARQRFERDCAHCDPDYFVISRTLVELQKQPDLSRLLFDNYPVLVRRDRYIIFDLKHPLQERKGS